MQRNLSIIVVRVSTRQELKIAKRVTAYNAGELSRVVRVDEREEEGRKWNA